MELFHFELKSGKTVVGRPLRTMAQGDDQARFMADLAELYAYSFNQTGNPSNPTMVPVLCTGDRVELLGLTSIERVWVEPPGPSEPSVFFLPGTQG